MQIKRMLYKSRVRGVEDAVESWQFDHADAMRARDAEDLIRECLGIKEFLKRWSDEAWEGMRTDCFCDIQCVGSSLQQALREGLDVFDAVRPCIADAESREYALEGRNEFDRAEAELRSLSDHIAEHWPWMNEDVRKRSLADIEAGRVRRAQDVLDELRRTDN